MLIISFAWTSPAIRARRKLRTRRSWSPEYAGKFKAGSVCQAYDKGPRVGGKQICFIRLTKAPWLQNTRELDDKDDYELEGFAYMDEWGFPCPPKGLSGQEFLKQWKDAAEDVYVVDFEYVFDMAYKQGCAYKEGYERCLDSGLNLDEKPSGCKVLGQMCYGCHNTSCIRWRKEA